MNISIISDHIIMLRQFHYNPQHIDQVKPKSEGGGGFSPQSPPPRSAPDLWMRKVILRQLSTSHRNDLFLQVIKCQVEDVIIHSLCKYVVGIRYLQSWLPCGFHIYISSGLVGSHQANITTKSVQILAGELLTITSSIVKWY